MAKDLLSKRANIYSDRPSVPSIVDSKSSSGNGDGTGEYLPLMGRNGKQTFLNGTGTLLINF